MVDTREHDDRFQHADRSRSRRWPVGPIVLLLLIGAGTALWAFTRPDGKSSSSHSTSSAPPSTGSATTPTTPTTPASTGASAALPLGHLANTVDDPKRSGRATLDDAVKRVIVYGEEVNQLQACGATVGSTQSLSGAAWGAGFTEFKCSSPALAQRAVSNLAAWEKTQGFTVATAPISGVNEFARDSNPGNPSYPIQRHLRYVSGSTVIGIVVQAQRPAVASLAITSVLGASASAFPPA